MIQNKAIIKYIKEKNKWNKNQFQSIDWQSHGIAVRKKYQIKHFVSKYIHNYLLLGDLISRYSFQYPRECPSCKWQMEDQNHMLRCSSRHSQRKTLFQGLKEFSNHFPTDTNLKFLVL